MTAAGWVGRRIGRAGIVVVALLGLVAASCGSSGTKANEAGQASGTAGASRSGKGPCPSKPLAFGAPSAWQAIGNKPSNGATSPEPIYESKLSITNPNAVDLTVQAKAAVTTNRSIFDYGAGKESTSSGLQIVTFGEPSPAGGNRIDGKDIRIQTVMPARVPAGGSADLVARASTIVYATPLATKAVYGKGAMVANSQSDIDRCEIALDGAEPLKLLGGA